MPRIYQLISRETERQVRKLVQPIQRKPMPKKQQVTEVPMLSKEEIKTIRHERHK